MKNLIFECQNLAGLFRESVISAKPKFLGKTALEILRKDRQEQLTFGELAIKSYEFAFYLAQTKNIQVGDKIAILGKNRTDWDIGLWGIVLIGAIPVLIDPERRVGGVKKHLLNTDTRILVMADDYQNESSRKELKNFIPTIDMTSYRPVEKDRIFSSTRLAGYKIEVGQTAVILCTSGTTGDPREVELTHENLLANIQGSLAIVKIGPKDRLLHILPPHHSFGLTVGKLLPLAAGATNIYTDNYRQIPELLAHKKITIFVAVPALFSAIAKRIESASDKRSLPRIIEKIIIKYKWPKLRFCISGSAPLPHKTLQVFWQRGIQLQEGYGTTENSPVYGFNTNYHKLGSVGKPIPTLLVKIVNGEILLGGPCIAKGYYKNSEATKKIFETDENGVRWLHTGDMGYLDEDGCLYITGRKKYLIVLPGGKKVNPELVELALSQATYVKEILILPYLLTGPAGFKEETIGAIVYPDWDEIETKTGLSRLVLQTTEIATLKDLIWQSINEFQQKSPELSSFEKITSKEFLKIRFDDFDKTTTGGKIRREVYLLKQKPV